MAFRTIWASNFPTRRTFCVTRTSFSTGSFELIDFWLIVVTEGNEDEAENLPYENTSICPKGVDVRHYWE